MWPTSFTCTCFCYSFQGLPPSWMPRAASTKSRTIIAHSGYRVVLNNILGCEVQYHNILGFDCAPRTGIWRCNNIPIKANTWSGLMYNPTAVARGYSNILSTRGFSRPLCMSQGDMICFRQKIKLWCNLNLCCWLSVYMCPVDSLTWKEI